MDKDTEKSTLRKRTTSNLQRNRCVMWQDYAALSTGGGSSHQLIKRHFRFCQVSYSVKDAVTQQIKMILGDMTEVKKISAPSRTNY